MELNTPEDFEKMFPDEKSAVDFLCLVRWGSEIKCPKCKGGSPYVIEDGDRFKCSNNQCYAKFSVTTGSLIHASNIKIKDWLYYIFLFAKTKGRFTSAKDGKFNFVTSYMVDSKIDNIFLKTNKLLDTKWVFHQAVENLFLIRHEEFKKKHLFERKIIDPKEIIDLSDNEKYVRVLFFAKTTIWHSVNRRWIFYPFCNAEELIAETFINLSDGEMKNCNGEFFISILRKTLYRMWKQHIKETPKLELYIKNYRKEYSRKGSINLAHWYIKRLIDNKEGTRNWYHTMTKQEVIDFIETKRKIIKAKRLLNNKPVDIAFNEMILRDKKDRERMPEVRAVDY